MDQSISVNYLTDWDQNVDPSHIEYSKDNGGKKAAAESLIASFRGPQLQKCISALSYVQNGNRSGRGRRFADFIQPVLSSQPNLNTQAAAATFKPSSATKSTHAGHRLFQKLSLHQTLNNAKQLKPPDATKQRIFTPNSGGASYNKPPVAAVKHTVVYKV